MHTAELVGAALIRELDRVQASQGVDPHYRIKTQQIVAPDSPTQQVTGKLRPLVGVLAIGTILLLVVVSAAEGLETLRAEWSKRDLPKRDEKGDSIEGTPENERQPHRGRRKNRRASNAAPEPMMDGMTGLTQPERILRALSFRGDGTPAPPGELTLSGARLRERTGIKSSSIYVVTRRLRNEGKIERDGRGRWRLPARRQMADNGHRSEEATRAAGAENGTESVSGNGSTRTAPTERYRSLGESSRWTGGLEARRERWRLRLSLLSAGRALRVASRSPVTWLVPYRPETHCPAAVRCAGQTYGWEHRGRMAASEMRRRRTPIAPGAGNPTANKY